MIHRRDKDSKDKKKKDKDKIIFDNDIQDKMNIYIFCMIDREYGRRNYRKVCFTINIHYY